MTALEDDLYAIPGMQGATATLGTSEADPPGDDARGPGPLVHVEIALSDGADGADASLEEAAQLIRTTTRELRARLADPTARPLEFYASAIVGDTTRLTMTSVNLSRRQLHDDLHLRAQLEAQLLDPVALLIEPAGDQPDPAGAGYLRSFGVLNGHHGLSTLIANYSSIHAILDEPSASTFFTVTPFAANGYPPSLEEFSVVESLQQTGMLGFGSDPHDVTVVWSNADGASKVYVVTGEYTSVGQTAAGEWPALRTAATALVDTGALGVTMTSGIGLGSFTASFHTGTCAEPLAVTDLDRQLVADLTAAGVAVTDVNAGACAVAW